MDKIQVLLVEDERTLAMIIKDTLEAQGFSITIAGDGEEGLRCFEEHRPDIVVADVMMPRMDGFEMVRRIRKQDRFVPVLFLTARTAVNDVVEGFHTGGDDYLKKPFGMQELIVRINALVARARRYDPSAIEHKKDEDHEVLDIGRYHLDVYTQQLTIDKRAQDLSHRETQLLRMLAEHPGEVVESRRILLDLWGDDSFFNSRSLQVFITKLRHKLSLDENIQIINVRGIGYRLIV